MGWAGFLDESSHLYMSACPSVGGPVRPSVICFFQMPKMSSFHHENPPGGTTTSLLNVLNLLHVLNVLRALNMLMDPSLACWALFSEML